MTVLKFRLTGETAFFKKPDVNSYVYFTYGQIHKVSLLGLFGAVLGLDGYTECTRNLRKGKKIVIPEFYNKLKNLKVSVVPNARNGVFPKKIQRFNNTVGYASKEQGGNLIVTEQWLEHPDWNIYIKVEDEFAQKLVDAFINRKCRYIPYLGKNEHFASILNVQVFHDEKINENIDYIDSLFVKENASFQINGLEEEEEEEKEEAYELPFKYEEKLPVRVNPDTGLYELDSFVFTNMKLSCYHGDVYWLDEKNIVFY